MRFLVPVTAASGLVLFAAGVMRPRRIALSRRVDFYLTRDPRVAARSSAELFPRSAIRRLAELVPPNNTGLQRRLAAAGSAMRPSEFRMQQMLWATFAASATALGLGTLALLTNLDARVVIPISGIAAVTAYLGRDWWLGRQEATRRARLVAELPVAIDLLTLSIMAGDSVPSALARVAGQIRSEVGVELAEVVGQIRAGSPVVEALEELSHRIPEPNVARLVEALCTGIEKGAPLAEVLRAQAEDGRELRRRMLVELGGRREVLMLVPVVFLIMPVVVVFALYPGLISLGLLVP